MTSLSSDHKMTIDTMFFFSNQVFQILDQLVRVYIGHLHIEDLNVDTNVNHTEVVSIT